MGNFFFITQQNLAAESSPANQAAQGAYCDTQAKNQQILTKCSKGQLPLYHKAKFSYKEASQFIQNTHSDTQSADNSAWFSYHKAEYEEQGFYHEAECDSYGYYQAETPTNS